MKCPAVPHMAYLRGKASIDRGEASFKVDKAPNDPRPSALPPAKDAAVPALEDKRTE